MSKKTTAVILPRKAEENLKILGEQIRLARLRRGLTQATMAERCGCTVLTLIRVEKGAPSVSMGIYVKILFGLGLADDILLVAQSDPIGRAMQDLDLKHRTIRKKIREDEYDFN